MEQRRGAGRVRQRLAPRRVGAGRDPRHIGLRRGTHLRASDPWVTFSPDGTAYYFTLASSAGNDSELLV